MTLQEKFNSTVPIEFGGMYEPLLNDCEKIADDFAIGFSEWCIQWRVEFVDDTQEGVLYTYGGLCEKFTMKKLLEIYKKKGL
jgi:hypothetical protein